MTIRIKNQKLKGQLSNIQPNKIWIQSIVYKLNSLFREIDSLEDEINDLNFNQNNDEDKNANTGIIWFIDILR